jgi:adenine-specific DNA-methyltransferase
VKAYLIAPLLYAASYVSNTSGVFKAYHQGWGGTTGTALYRILSDVHLVEPVLWRNDRRNIALCMDALEVARRWDDIVGDPLDIAYLDPPYNQHPYGSNYHLLNTLALWDKPEIAPISRGTKSAIRTDWRTERRSAYNHARDALAALTELVDTLPARWIVISYSTDGNIPADQLLAMLAQRGPTCLVPRRYKRYRVSTPRMSPRPHTVEFVAVLDRRVRPGRDIPFRPASVQEQLDLIARSAGHDPQRV